MVEGQMTLSRFKALGARIASRAAGVEEKSGEMSRSEFRDFLKQSGFVTPVGKQSEMSPGEVRDALKGARFTAPQQGIKVG